MAVTDFVLLGVTVFVGVIEGVIVRVFVVEGVELVLDVGVGLDEGHRSFSHIYT